MPQLTKLLNGQRRTMKAEEFDRKFDDGEDITAHLDLSSARRPALARTDAQSKLAVTSVITCDPDVMGGTPVFAGTRVPVQTFLDYIEGGESIDDFLEGFPSVTREQVVEYLRQATNLLISRTS